MTNTESRLKFVEALAEALNDVFKKLALNSEGDYRPDLAAERFPDWKPAEVQSALARERSDTAPTVSALFKGWREFSGDLKAKTADRYAPCLRSLQAWAKGRSAAELSADDIWAWAGQPHEGRWRSARDSQPCRPCCCEISVRVGCVSRGAGGSWQATAQQV